MVKGVQHKTCIIFLKSRIMIWNDSFHDVILHPDSSPDGGTGRRVRLKIWYSQGCAGSIPVPGT